MGYRLEDQGVTLRLFYSVKDAQSSGVEGAILGYAFGFLVRDGEGRYLDAHGVLPSSWNPLRTLMRDTPDEAVVRTC